MTNILNRLVSYKNLDVKSTEKAMRLIMSGYTTSAQIGSFLTALRMKGEKPEEVAALAKIMRKFCKRIDPKITDSQVLIDTCGTGGDKLNTFNISTISALILAAANIPVAKHGNRSITSKCGSADFLEGFGVKIDAKPEVVQNCIEKAGIGFMFAPIFHPAMKNVMPARKELGIRTVFNILGPLTNPANAQAQILGIFSPDLTEKMTEVLKILGIKRALTFHGMHGLDEISNLGNTKISELKDGEIINYQLNVKDFGLEKGTVSDIKGGNVQENIKIALDIFMGHESPKSDIVMMNVAAGLYVTGKVDKLTDGIEYSREIIKSGKPIKKLEELVKLSGGSLEDFRALREIMA
ncbi:MAG: anthranilate phosphoribosyltransferase [Candidatus Lokiarchaeota archaeon]|nr:anthranilate phosphoribosyltransferase [Candidatus Lokiarchaeota archaeon]